MWGASNPAWCYSEAGVGVRGKVRGGSSQKRTFTKHSGIGKTFQAAGRVWTKEERGKRVLFLGCMVHWGTPDNHFPLPCPWTRYRQTRIWPRVTHSVSTASRPSPGPFLQKDFPGRGQAEPVRGATGHTGLISSSQAAPQSEAPACPPWSSLEEPPRKRLRECS